MQSLDQFWDQYRKEWCRARVRTNAHARKNRLARSPGQDQTEQPQETVSKLTFSLPSVFWMPYSLILARSPNIQAKAVFIATGR